MNSINKKIGSSLLAGSIILSNVPVQTFALETEAINNESINTDIEIKEDITNIKEDTTNIVEDVTSKTEEVNQAILDNTKDDDTTNSSDENTKDDDTTNSSDENTKVEDITNSSEENTKVEDITNSSEEEIEDKGVINSLYADVEDEGLLRFFNTTLKKSDLTAPVTISEIATIKGIVNLSEYKVKSLEGLQYATGITDLHLDDCEISDLTPLANLTNLKTLYASNNKITDLTPISSLQSLFWIEVNNNNITDISVLSGLPNLYAIHAKNNKITNVNLHSLPELEYLDLDNNSLVNLHLNSLPKLYTLRANNNKITNANLHSLPALQSLHLDNNKLTTLDINSLPKIMEVCARYNDITELNVTSLSNLRSLEISNNKITHINLDSLSALLMLDLSNNTIRELNITTLPNLRYLGLSNNNMSNISFVNVKNTPLLTAIDVSNNNLTDISSISNIQSLNTLIAYNNKIIDASFINNLPKLDSLFLNNNNISELIIENAPVLSGIEINSNKLTKLEIKNAPVLSTISANDNNLSDVDFDIDTLTNLSIVTLDGNNFNKLPDFVSKRRFMILSFARNNISDISNIYDVGYVCIDENNVTDISHLGTLSSLDGASIGKQTLKMPDLNTNSKDVSINLPVIKDIYGNKATIKEVSNNGRLEGDSVKWNDLEEGVHTFTIKFEGPTITGNFIGQMMGFKYLDFELEITQKVTVDSNGPEISITPSRTDWTKDNITLDISANDKYNKVEKIILPDGTEVLTDNAKFEVSKNGSYEFKAVDSFGNVSIKTIEIKNIDKDIPTIKPNISTSTPTTGDVEINFNASDITSEVKAIYFINDKGERIEVEDIFKVSENGTYSFEIEDAAGNIHPVSITIDNIDKVAPTLSLKQSLKENGEIIIEVTTSDLEGDVDVIILPDGTEIKDNKANFVIKETGEFTFKVIDKAGNITEKTIYINLEDIDIPNDTPANPSPETPESSPSVDKSGPKITLEYNSKAWTNKPITVKVQASDKESGIDYIKLPNGEIINSNFAEYEIKTNGIYEFKSVDKSGNISSKIVNIKNIDTTKPNVTHSITKRGSEAIISILAKDPQSGVKSITSNSATYLRKNTFTAKENGIYSFIIEDNAGNKTEYMVEISYLSNVTPGENSDKEDASDKDNHNKPQSPPHNKPKPPSDRTEEESLEIPIDTEEDLENKDSTDTSIDSTEETVSVGTKNNNSDKTIEFLSEEEYKGNDTTSKSLAERFTETLNLPKFKVKADTKANFIENLLYAPIEIEFKNITVYDAPKIKKVSLSSRTTKKENPKSNYKYITINGEEYANEKIKDVEFTDNTLSFITSSGRVTLTIKEDYIMESIKEQIYNYELDASINNLSPRKVMDMIKVNKNRKHKPIEIDSYCVINNSKDSELDANFHMNLLKDNNTVEHSNTAIGTIKPNSSTKANSTLSIDTSNIDTGVYDLEQSIDLSDGSTKKDTRKIALLSIRTYLMIFIMIGILLASLTLYLSGKKDN